MLRIQPRFHRRVNLCRCRHASRCVSNKSFFTEPSRRELARECLVRQPAGRETEGPPRPRHPPLSSTFAEHSALVQVKSSSNLRITTASHPQATFESSRCDPNPFLHQPLAPHPCFHTPSSRLFVWLNAVTPAHPRQPLRSPSLTCRYLLRRTVGGRDSRSIDPKSI
jgi:hypothetical protein